MKRSLSILVVVLTLLAGSRGSAQSRSFIEVDEGETKVKVDRIRVWHKACQDAADRDDVEVMIEIAREDMWMYGHAIKHAARLSRSNKIRFLIASTDFAHFLRSRPTFSEAYVSTIVIDEGVATLLEEIFNESFHGRSLYDSEFRRLIAARLRAKTDPDLADVSPALKFEDRRENSLPDGGRQLLPVERKKAGAGISAVSIVIFGLLCGAFAASLWWARKKFRGRRGGV